MATFRELTQASHDAIEQLPLNKAIFEGSVTEAQWDMLLQQKYYLYRYIEERVEMPENLKREKFLWEDARIAERATSTLLPSTQRYIQHLQNLDDNYVWGHMYVHYMGELFGGQVLKKMIPFAKSHMDFESRKELVDWIREQLAGREQELAGEANYGFELSMRMYDEIFRVTQTSQ